MSDLKNKQNVDFGLEKIFAEAEDFLPLLGIWKLLGVIAILIPKFGLLKEWAYAGFFFAMSGAVVSHLACGDELIALFGPTLLIVLTIVSWYFRPESRKLAAVN